MEGCGRLCWKKQRKRLPILFILFNFIFEHNSTFFWLLKTSHRFLQWGGLTFVLRFHTNKKVSRWIKTPLWLSRSFALLEPFYIGLIICFWRRMFSAFFVIKKPAQRITAAAAWNPAERFVLGKPRSKGSLQRSFPSLTKLAHFCNRLWVTARMSASHLWSQQRLTFRTTKVDRGHDNSHRSRRCLSCGAFTLDAEGGTHWHKRPRTTSLYGLGAFWVLGQLAVVRGN